MPKTKTSDKKIPRDPDAPAFAWSETDEQAAIDSAIRASRKGDTHSDLNPQTQMEPTPRSLHTPGPWKYGGLSECIITKTGVEIANLSESDVDEKEANARLIAAAPDLLTICQDLADFLKPRSGMVDLARGGDASAFHRDLRNLIAKVEGRS